ncbi:CBS domain-containing protein [Streptomyces noursei]|uniref:CBS domain-containing protein n=2 Tax=Streptomyces noursei TaxID=1971 RepID=UPI00167501B3|nr:CBS domain-containing protein [Streptomyces noursei]MCZ1019012.1 CBS domain-containing protein [Streptomyces noursei]
MLRQIRLPMGRFGRAVGDAMASPGPQVGDDMIVDVALAVLDGARADHLLVRDEDGRCTGLVTRSQMTAHQRGSWYTEETRLRDIVYDRGPFISPAMPVRDAERAMRRRALPASPVIDGDGHALGILVLTP